ncbi:MAG: hypothetical protein RRX93_05600 [Bacteroidales bacterium]
MNKKVSHKIWTSLVVMLSLCLCVPSFAQNRTQKSNAIHKLYGENFMVSLVPIPLFFHGFRVDLDARIKDNLWINIAPQYNYHRSLHNYQKTDTLRLNGFCLEVNMRYYEPRAKGLYFAVGLGVDYNIINEFNKKNQQFYSVNSTRLGGQIQMGYMVKMWPRAVFDVYIGAAFRGTINKYSQEQYKQNMEYGGVKPWSYAFGGVFMEAGVRIGLML